jgi:hypothetical protein
MSNTAETFYSSGEWRVWIQKVLKENWTMPMILNMCEHVFPSLEVRDQLLKDMEMLRHYYVTMTCLLDIIGFTCKNPFSAVYESEHSLVNPKFWKTQYPAFEVGDTTASHCREFDLLIRIMESFADTGFGNHSVALFNRLVELFQRKEFSGGVSADYIGKFRPRAVVCLARIYGPDFTLLSGNSLLKPEAYPSIAAAINALKQADIHQYEENGKSYVFPLCKHGLSMRLVKDGKRGVMTFKCHLATEAGANCHVVQDTV